MSKRVELYRRPSRNGYFTYVDWCIAGTNRAVAGHEDNERVTCEWVLLERFVEGRYRDLYDS